jgi:hypothetical protein
MSQKIKKCKGQGKTKGYGCGVKLPFTSRNGIKSYKSKYGLGLNCGCFSDWLLNSNQGKEILTKTIKSVQRPRIELEKAKEENKKNKSLSYLIQNTVNVCHEYIRLRDKYKPCISCNESWHDEFQAGHFYKAELYSSLKFEEKNINGQCKGCNLHKEGNESGYRVGFIKRYSKGELDLLDSKALLEKKDGFKWDRIKLQQIQKYYKQKIKELKNAS